MRTTVTSVAFTLMLIMGGCGASIRTSTAPNAELGRYKTFAFYRPPYQAGQAETIADQTIRSALKQNLAQKGLVEVSGSPEFLVAYHVKEQQKFDVNSVGYGFWGPPGADVTEYTQGTLIVDFIDPQTKQVFWRGTASEVVNQPLSPDPVKLEKAVAKIVQKYPSMMASTPRTTM